MIHRYHDGSKHAFHRFARSLGYLDWASQPSPFRSFSGAPATALSPRPDAPSPSHTTTASVGAIFRHALGLTAWKQFQASRWSLRANPSSGNLHPTEGYVVSEGTVSHYAPDRHALELRCAFEPPLPAGVVLIALTSIHWREAWKYGERAFRYCQHDLGHAVAAIRIAAALVGCTARLMPEWSHAEIATLTGIDRDEDFVDAEREEPGCVLILGGATGGRVESVSPAAVLQAIERGRWTGRANQLSEDHVQWTFIDEIAGATRDPGRAVWLAEPTAPEIVSAVYPSKLIVGRRSAVAFDGRSSIARANVMAMLRAVMPDGPVFDALWWSARIHLLLFVHRVDGLDAGIYLLLREPASGERLTAALGREFSMEPAGDGGLPLIRLSRGDCRTLARRLSCDQEIAADGFYSVGMIAEFDHSLDEFGPSFYRHLFWESGVVGQVLYLEAEAAGARATGIGCFYDDPVHDVLGLRGHAFQSLYHFTVGMPVEDSRLTTEPGYAWESREDR